ncbi:MAG: hypothetical protein M3083_05545 [Actinomycetota bacterium]|nr:hypothetical protein [Actinomycetota bacterium]
MLGDICDVCGQSVAPGDAYQAEVSCSQMMCPTSMTFHQGCYERASELWQPDDSYCTADPDFPEMAAWLDMSGRQAES